MTDDVTFQRGEYTALVEVWAKIDAACSGEEAVKAGTTTYLPRPNSLDNSKEADQRYKDYVARACYFNAAGRTLSALVGVAFGKWPEVEYAAGLDYMGDDADGSGVGLVNQAQLAVMNTLKHGRCALLVDYPTVQAPASLAQQQAGYARATMTLYPAKSVINWRAEKRGAKSLLTLVVIAEKYQIPGQFAMDEGDQWRVLKLGTLSTEEAGPERYVVQLWRRDDKGTYYIEKEYVPLDGAGRPWTEIPFAFCGAVNNDDAIDESPMLALANLNLAHYRNSADYEESIYFSGQPQAWATGIDQNWYEMWKKDGIYWGSRSILAGPVGSAFGIVQAEPNTMAKEGMDAKEKMMAALGARLVEPGSGAKTASQSDSEEKVSHSVLSLVCDNVSNLYSRALVWAGQFMNVTQADEAFDIDTDFGVLTVDAQQLTAVVAAWQGGKIPDSDGFAYLRKVGLMDASKTDEEAKGEIEASGGGLALDEANGNPAPVA